MVERNAEVSPDRRIEFRIGINLGDVITDGTDIFGDGVNIAARLEGISDRGGICISRQVLDQIEGKLDLAYRELGRQNLKNIAKPVEVCAIRLDAAVVPGARFLAAADHVKKRGPQTDPLAVNYSGTEIGEMRGDGISRHADRRLPLCPDVPDIWEKSVHFDWITL
jgi:hypothetical protein